MPSPDVARTQTEFFTAKAKLTLVSIDDHTTRIVAQYNPKELQLTQPITWSATTPIDHADPIVAFGGVQAQTLQIELLFDGYESGVSVQSKIDAITKLATERLPQPGGREPRPHVCLVVWGTQGMPRLSCVIDSVATKYLMFGGNGTALRASCTVSLKEARHLARAGAGNKAGPDAVSQDYSWYRPEAAE